MLRPYRELAMEYGPVIITTATSHWALFICQASHWYFKTNSSHPHNNPIMWVLSCPVYKWVNWGSEESRYVPRISHLVPQELALECRLPTFRLGCFPFPDPATLDRDRENQLLSHGKRDVYLPVELTLGLLCRDASETQILAGFICGAGGMPCQTARHIFVTLRNQGNFCTWQR